MDKIPILVIHLKNLFINHLPYSILLSLVVSCLSYFLVKGITLMFYVNAFLSEILYRLLQGVGFVTVIVMLIILNIILILITVILRIISLPYELLIVLPFKAMKKLLS